MEGKNNNDGRRKRSVVNLLHLTILESIKKSGGLPKDLINKNLLHYHVSRLKKQGLIKQIGYGTWQLIDPKTSVVKRLGLTTNQPYEKLHFPKETEVCSDDVRVHNIVFKLKVDTPLSWETRLQAAGKSFVRLKFGVLRVFVAGWKVWLCKGSVRAFVPVGVDYTAKKVSKGLLLAVSGFFAWLPSLEAFLGFSLRSRGVYVWSINRKHLSLVKNALAMDYNSRKEKFRVYDERGLWLIADDSYNLNELEFVRSSTNQSEAGRVQSWFNDFKANPNLPLTSESYKLILGLVAGLAAAKGSIEGLASNQEAIFKILKEMRGGV